MPGAFNRLGNEHLRISDDFKSARMVLTHPRFIIAQHVDVLEQLHIPFHTQQGAFFHWMEGGQKNTELQIAFSQGLSISRHGATPRAH